MFKTKNGFIHRKIAGNDVLISVGKNIANFNGYVELNPSALVLWNRLKAGAEKEELIQQLIDTYGLDEARACKDVEAFLGELLSHDMIEELA